jgi:hypothetical protein
MATLDHAQLQTMGANGRHKVEAEFSEQMVIRKYIQTISTIKKAS